MDFKAPGVLREYATSLNDDELKYLLMRLDQRFGGDVGEAVLLLQHNEGIDNWLRTARSYEEFFRLLDVVQNHMEYESKRRSR